MRRLTPDETILRGSWINTPAGMKPDETSLRIDALTANSLVRIGTDRSGWEILFKDPEDNRLWELTYLDSDTHGGGPPVLRNLSIEEAKTKYNMKLE